MSYQKPYSVRIGHEETHAVYELIHMVAREDHGAVVGDVLTTDNFDVGMGSVVSSSD